MSNFSSPETIKEREYHDRTIAMIDRSIVLLAKYNNLTAIAPESIFSFDNSVSYHLARELSGEIVVRLVIRGKRRDVSSYEFASYRYMLLFVISMIKRHRKEGF